MKRYPLQALADAEGVELSSLTHRLGISGSTWKEYRDRGVSEKVADRLASKLGLPVLAVWPEMIDDAIDDVSIECADCAVRFVPTRSHQRYCSQRCRRRAGNRKWRQTDAGREWERSARRKRYQETGEYERARERARYAANVERERERMRVYRLTRREVLL